MYCYRKQNGIKPISNTNPTHGLTSKYLPLLPNKILGNKLVLRSCPPGWKVQEERVLVQHYNQMVEKRTETPQKQTKQNQPQPTGRDFPIKQYFLCTSETKTADYLEEPGSESLCSSKISKKSSMDSPVTSGHCTEWQKHGHKASSGHWCSLTQV